MKKYIYLPQEELVSLSLGVSEGLILNYILEATNWAEGLDVDGERYFRIHTGKIMSDLPILGIATKSGILRKVNALIRAGLINKKIKKNTPYYKLTEKCRAVFFSGEGGASSQHKCDHLATQGSASSQHKVVRDGNTIVSYNSKLDIEQSVDEIYTLYSSRIPREKRKYTKSAQAKLYIKQLLKEYDREALVGAVREYYRRTDSKYVMACQYFFSNTTQGKTYRPFVDYIVDKPTTINQYDLDESPF